MIRSALTLNPACPSATGRSPRRLPPLPSPHAKANPVAIKRVKAQVTTAKLAPSQRRHTHRVAVSTTTPMRQHHSLELALEEADVGFYAEQQLRQANVSPFFSSSKAPDSAAIPLPELELQSPRMGPRRVNYEAYSISGRNFLGVVMSPLSLDLDDSYSDTRSLSRSSSWQDFELLSDNAPAPRLRGRSPRTTDSYSSYEGKASSAASTEACWDAFLSEHSTTNTKRVSLAHAMKTPTAETTSSYPGFFPYSLCKEDPTAFSPTHIDKKVLVTESDLKLPSSSFDALTEPAFRSLDMDDGYDWGISRRESFVPHHRHKSTPPNGHSSCRSKREKLFPREAPMKETHERPQKRAKLQQPTYRHRSVSTTPPAKVSSSRHTRPTHHDESSRGPDLGQYVRNVHRLPGLVSDPHPNYSQRDQYEFPVMNDHRKRTALQEHVTKPSSQLSQQRLAPERRPMAVPHQLDGHHELLYLPRIIPSANYMKSPRLPKPSRRKIGIYGPEARRERLRRFHEKRKQRVFHKRIKYDCRKRLANACPRIKGRFVKKDAKEEETKQMPLDGTSHSSSTSGSEEDDERVHTIADVSTELPSSTTALAIEASL